MEGAGFIPKPSTMPGENGVIEFKITT